ncbi:MAG: hypothetical protein KME21_30615 [Desmonostoc vinosum HA7617-LM4]|jgi:hypothetical protein|nr:hypothetical protein [Desmonostoc vinosum HA7617-LM4]
MKLMMALAATTLIVTSTFMETAVAQRRTRNGHSVTGSNEASVDIQFDLVNATRDGVYINPERDSANPNLVVFRGAIENYKGGFGLAAACSRFGFVDSEPPAVCKPSGYTYIDPYYFDSSGFLILREVYTYSGSLYDGDLYAELIPNDPLFRGRDTIEYKILKSGETPEAELLTRYRLDFSVLDINRNQAQNDLTYILQQNLFSKAKVILTDFDGSLYEDIGAVLLQNSFEEDIKNIPESQTQTGVLVLGILGLILFIKRKVKHQTS